MTDDFDITLHSLRGITLQSRACTAVNSPWCSGSSYHAIKLVTVAPQYSCCGLLWVQVNFTCAVCEVVDGTVLDLLHSSGMRPQVCLSAMHSIHCCQLEMSERTMLPSYQGMQHVSTLPTHHTTPIDNANCVRRLLSRAPLQVASTFPASRSSRHRQQRSSRCR